MPIDSKRFLATFLDEAAEHVCTLEEGLLRLESEPHDQDLVDSIFRSAHSLKGASATLGLKTIAALTHALETVLEAVRQGQLEPRSDRVDVLLRATDALRTLLAATHNGSDPGVDVAPLVQALEQTVAGNASKPVPVTPVAPAAPHGSSEDREVEVVFVPHPEFLLKGMDPLLLLRDLAGAGEVIGVEVHLEALPSLEQFRPDQCYLGWTMRLRTTSSLESLRELFMFVEDDCRLEIRSVPPPEMIEAAPADSEPAAEAEERRSNAGRTAGRTPQSSSIRVATERLDRLVDLVGEVVIVQSMLNQAISDFTPDKIARLQEAVAEMARHTRELQERVMSIRMLPVDTICSRFPRLVRDLSAALGKTVRFQVSGGETELDKSLIERLGDPLVHLVRNAIDHGIEDRSGRLAAGKPEQGTILLRAAHRGGKVVIEIQDDGKGLDRERIAAKARALGLLPERGELTDQEIFAFIFHPGFSTADKVSDLSGRGVGMDVVKRTIDGLNGTIAIETEQGIGTCFRITLPLTLAILDGLCVRVCGETYVVPLVSILESLRLRSSEIRLVAGRNEVVAVRGQALPLVRLDRLFHLAPPATAEPSPWALVVIVENEGTRIALLVDDIQGQSQVVIKSLEANYRRVEGLMGATILGDGRVALILDVHALGRRANPVGGPIAAASEIHERQVSA